MNSSTAVIAAPLAATPLAYDAKQLAALLGVSVRTIRRLAASGQLPRSIKLGRSVRWSAQAIDAWLKAGSPPSRSLELSVGACK